MRFGFCKTWFRYLAVTTLLSLAAPAQAPIQSSSKPAVAPPSEWSATANPEHLVNGAPLLFEVKPPSALASLTATWLTHSLTFVPGANASWFAIAGISLETEPGTYPLELTGTTKDGQKLHYEQKFVVASEKYETVELKVSKDFTAPSPEQMEIIKRDQEKIGRAHV